MSEEIRVAIVYHSGYGHTKRMAESVAQGAKGAGAQVALINVDDIDIPLMEEQDPWKTLDEAHAIIFGAPTYMGAASAGFKAFAEKTTKIWYVQGWKDKVAGGFTNSGAYSGDKLATLQQFAVLAAQHSMVWVSLGILAGYNSSQGSTSDLNRVGSYLGPMAQSNIDQGPEGMEESDLKTAELYGARVAEAARRWNAGRAEVMA